VIIGYISALFKRWILYIYCYSVSVIVMLLTFSGVLVSFIFAACSHFGSSLQWFCRGVGCLCCQLVFISYDVPNVGSCESMFLILKTSMNLGVSAMSLKGLYCSTLSIKRPKRASSAYIEVKRPSVSVSTLCSRFVLCHARNCCCHRKHPALEPIFASLMQLS
jgi:hypothetical protein